MLTQKMIVGMIVAGLVYGAGLAEALYPGPAPDTPGFVDRGDQPGPESMAEQPPYKPGELLVRFGPKANGQQRTVTERNALLASIGGGTVKHSYKLVSGLTLVKLPENLTVRSARPTFENAHDILYAEPNWRLRGLSSPPNDPCFPQLWGMHNTGQTGGTPDADIDANEAWGIHTGSMDIIVAVIDTGVDYNHPDVAGNMWVNEAELTGEPNVDDDGNGYKDDIYGYDFCTWGGKERDSDPIDDRYHGTHCAGTVGAVGNNGEGVTGVCWKTRIMALKFLSSTNDGWTSDAIDAIEYGVAMGATVLSNSWGGSQYSQGLKNAIEAADANGVLFVAAAGNADVAENPDNDESPRYPASYDCNNIIAVMATDHNDTRSIWRRSSSAYGATSVDLAAPGSDILSCLLDGEYGYDDGTSTAAPHVAGACALAWSRNPGLSHLEVKDIILNTVDELEALDGLCVTGGRLNLHNAVRGAASITLSKDDGLDPNESVLPDDYVQYSITYANPVTDENDPAYIGEVNDVNILDYLPDEIDVNDVNASDGGVYDCNVPKVTWHIPTLKPGDSNFVTVTVRITGDAEPCSVIANLVLLETAECRKIATKQTPVDCFGPEAIYVSPAATGANVGTSWGDAYTDLQSALGRARKGCGSQIWVVEGTYSPGTTLELVDGVALYGGFDGNETSLEQRNWVENKTILDGNGGVDRVVSAEDINETSIDGFTITTTGGQASMAGIHCANSCLNIVHNRIEELTGNGIQCEYSDLNISNCLIGNNNGRGILCAYYSSLTLEASEIRNNYYKEGIYCHNEAVIKNSWIHHNLHGVYFMSCENPVIRNTTIAHNSEYGVLASYADPNVSNCIVWGNTDGSILSDSCNVTYSCIQGGHEGQGNINEDPNFLAPDVNDYHLTFGSPCVDTADTNLVSEGETDIDGHPRVMGYEVDMGADEDYPNCDASDYNEWADVVGRPDCWCYPRQCHGDADNASETKSNYWVYVADLTILLSGWGKAIGDMSGNEICADFDHAAETKANYRAYVADLTILLNNWGTSAVDPNCLYCE